MCNFEVGQTVIRTSGYHMTVKTGDICKVTGVCDDGSLKLQGHDGSYDDNCFALYAPPNRKTVTVDVCHRIVAYDCEIGSLQAQLDNLREAHQRQLEQLESTISTLTYEMDTLKAEYNVE